jgi:hypothetical protein
MVTLLSPGYVTLDGLVLSGRESVPGADIVMESLTGWGSPGARTGMADKARAHGAWVGDSFLRPRNLAAAGHVLGESPQAAQDAVEALIEACGLSLREFAVTETDRTRHVYAQRTDEVIVTWLTDRVAKWSIQLVAPDPRKFGADLWGTAGLPIATGGLTVPFTVPFSVDSTVERGQVSLTNEGNIAGPVRLRIDGPVTGPIVTHVSSGRSLVFASTVSLGAGEWIDVDMEARTVLANGQASRNGWVTSRGWSQFEPGVNTWSFTAAVYDPASLLTVTAAPSWM